MAKIYKHNPLSLTCSLEDIVWRIVFPDEQPSIDIEDLFSGKHWDKHAGALTDDPDNNPPPLLEIIHDDLNRARSAESEAISAGLPTEKVSEIKATCSKIEIQLHQAVDLIREIRIEADILRRNENISNSGLILSDEAMVPSSPIIFMQYSVYGWALDKHAAEIPEWARPGEYGARTGRKHSTRLLQILDDMIMEHWENHDPKRPPKNDMIKAWIKEKYPNDSSMLSDKIIDSMCKIARPQPLLKK